MTSLCWLICLKN